MKFRNLVIIILFLCSLLTFKMDFKVFADMDENIDVYSVYDENFNLLFQKDFVEVGDNYLSKDFKFYEIVYVDKDTVKFDIDGHEVELDKWKAESLIQMLVDFDKEVK